MTAATPEPLPVGILGGTFDPVHFGHLRLAECAREQLGLEHVLWVPAGQPPHRAAPRAEAAHRLEMVRLAIAENPGFALDDSEILAQESSYTITTLERLRALHGAARPLVLLLGVDAFLGLPGWHRWRALFDFAHVAVANRPGYPLESAELPQALAAQLVERERRAPRCLQSAPAGAICTFEITPLGISASAIRMQIGTGASPRYLLPESVLDYIQAHRLYSLATDGP
jgi:nicotinate-nucleotide adenylyltransferase